MGIGVISTVSWGCLSAVNAVRVRTYKNASSWKIVGEWCETIAFFFSCGPPKKKVR